MRTIRVPGEDQRALFLIALRRFFGDFSEHHLAKVLPNVDWIEYTAGEFVMEEGTPAGEVFFVVSGRLRVVTRTQDGGTRLLGEMSRGEAIGEIALLAGTARTASVFAIRPSVLVRLPKAAFEELLSDHPAVSMKLAGLIIERLHRANAPPSLHGRPTSVALISLSPTIDVRGIAEQLAVNLDGTDTVAVITEREFEEHFASEAQNASRFNEPQFQFKVTRWLDDVEVEHGYLLLAADCRSDPWASSCIRHADEVLLFADPTLDGATAVLDTELMNYVRTQCIAAKRLVLVQPQSLSVPRNTATWLNGIELAGHLHVRAGVRADVARLGRIVSRSAVGLVLSGGGAKGFAHLGAYKALRELEIPIDFVAGTSMGAAVGAMIALEMPADEALDECRRLFNSRLAFDLNLLPLISILSGRRVKSRLARIFSRADGTAVDIEDTWRTFFCIASSYSRAREVVLRRGPLDKLVRASLSMPVFLPPVIHDSEALLDGALMNNFPTEEMSRLEVGFIIGVDLRGARLDASEVGEIPATWQLVRDLFSTSPGRSPRMPYLLNVLYDAPTLHSHARQIDCARSADVLIRPELGTLGTLQWGGIDSAFQAGYAAARSQLGALRDFKGRRSNAPRPTLELPRR